MCLESFSDKTIIVRLPNWVGDVCMIMPSLALLVQTGAKLILCGKPFAQSLVHSVPNSDFIPITGAILKDARQLRLWLRRNSHAEIKGLLFPDSLTSALTFRLAGINSVGYRDDARSVLLKWPVDKPQDKHHAVLKWYRLTCHAIEQWHLPLPEPAPAVPPSYNYKPALQDLKQLQKTLDAHQLTAHQYVLLAPTATGLHKGQVKVWSGFEPLAQHLVQAGWRVVVCPPNHEREQATQATPDAELIEPLPLGVFAELVRHARLVVCNDSGVSHIAALVGAQQMTLFGVTDPEHTGPWSTHAHNLGKLGQWPSVETVLNECLSELKKETSNFNQTI